MGVLKALLVVVILAFAGSFLYQWFDVFVVGRYYESAPLHSIVFVGLVIPVAIAAVAYYLAKLVLRIQKGEAE